MTKANAMNWNTAARKLGLLLRPTAARRESAEAANDPQVERLAHEDSTLPIAVVRKLRRRLLSGKGARLLVSMVERQDRGMLAILDANGLVVYWHDGMLRQDVGKDVGTDGILDRHVAQFYAPKTIAETLARGHLCKAFARGSSAEFGWRRRPDGTVFWGMTVIEPLLLKDGRLQGFTHVTRAVSEPRVAVESRDERPSIHWSGADVSPRGGSFARVAQARRWAHARSGSQRPQFAYA
jgi:hypothetical protein